MPNYQAKSSDVLRRQLKVERLVIPFTVTANATPASKSLANDEPSVLFMNAQGVTQISVANGALDSGEAVPSFDLALSDAGGTLNVLVKISEQIVKIMQARVSNRSTGAVYACYHNVSNPDTDANNDKLLLNINTGVNFATTSLDACIEVEYITEQ